MLLPTLDEIVINTLHLYQDIPSLPKLDLSQFHTPLVVGSGNGYYTGRILFRDVGAYFAVESEVERKLENIPSITDVVVVSASGEKHAPMILEAAKKHGKKTFLISSSESSSGRTLADESIIMPKIREPYTYNTSTYFGYILAEDPTLDLLELEIFLRETLLGITQGVDWKSFTSFFIVLPDRFVLLREMLEVKFIELFGRKVAHDTFSYEQMKHATTVIQDEKELFLCFGNTTKIQYGKNQIDLPIFSEDSQKSEIRGRENFSQWAYSDVSNQEKSFSDKEVRSFSESSTSYAAMMLVGYYLIGQIQKSLPPYFMDSIEDYCIRAKAQSGFDIKPWVEI